MESKLILENVVQEIAVLACLRVVDEVVGAHKGCNASLDGVRERPSIDLVHRLVVNLLTC